MLFDVAALLITSAALGSAAEASSAPAAAPISQVVDFPTVGVASGASNLVLVDPAAVTHPVSISTFEIRQAAPASLTSVTGISLLRELSVLPATQIAAFIGTHPSVVTKLLASPPSAVEVSDWWGSMASSERDALSTSAPQLVGNLDGVPAAVRNTQNRAWVTQSIGSLKTTIAQAAGRAIAQSDQSQLHMLGAVKAALKTKKGEPVRSLLSIDPSGQGKAAIVLGDLQTADYVTYMVPGMFFTVDGQVHDWTGDAQDLYNQEVAWLKRVDAQQPGEPARTVAVVAWMGYQTPDLTNIGSLDLAYKGRDALARVVEGMQALRAGNLPYTTIVAHSYGSTAALMALTEYDFSVDALVLVGSPGSAAQSVTDLHVRDANVFVGSAPWDPVPSSAWFGSDPAAPGYGAKTMAVGGGTDVITGKELAGSVGHNEYFDSGSESIRNMALVGIDQPKLVMDGSAKDKTRTLALLQ